ncbi:MAG: glycerol-3-phosphate dehydrogenase/oxidase [Bacteroidota bacterium]
MTREEKITKLSEEKKWDILVIGGGASGLGVALDAASRGFSTVLFEQYDFAKGTSSKSTKLVHGGVRYLAQGNIELVKVALEERGRLARNARHLFKVQEFVIPNYSWWKGPYYALGLKFYDFLSKRLSIGKSTWISKKEVLNKIPTLEPDDLSNGISYFDGQFDDARLALSIAQTAEEQGATLLNYARIIGVLKDANDLIEGVEVEDRETGNRYKVYAKVLVNAAGIYTDKVLKLYNPSHKKTVVPSQGIHLMLDRSFLQGDTAIMIPKTSDGRVLFIIPWHDKVIAGTTDTLIKKPSIEPLPLEEEVDFILETINQYVTIKASRSDVLSVFSGLRPLAKPKKDETRTKEVSRSHKIIVDNQMVSIVGGKWTTYRKMAEDVVDTITAQFDLEDVASPTRDIELHGNISASNSIPVDHLRMYGSDREAYLSFENSTPGYEEVIHKNFPFTMGQVIWSIRFEMARTVEDVLSRRMRMLLLDARAAIESAPRVASWMAQELGRDGTWEASQITEFTKLANKYLLN